ncbi:hypothetical protein [Streptococcus oricebi]|uniref:Uncharacterized protein n=1 Tax=Streptococcus oricebi TaxID=1547447 RepID=A0ABS5B652_9STRE|nr:hypothetical protein [Streptococcus oricebi]MBP2624308.1 hypothetical protein [Streptococcus oricebi]
MEKQNRLAKSLSNVQTDMLGYTTTKGRLAAGGLTAHKQIFLDSEQALTIAKGLSEISTAGRDTMKTDKQAAIGEAEALLASTREVPWGFALSPDELEAVYQEAGVDHSSIVSPIEAYFQQKIDKSGDLAQTFTDLESQIKEGIDQQLEADQELAREFREWKNLT